MATTPLQFRYYWPETSFESKHCSKLGQMRRRSRGVGVWSSVCDKLASVSCLGYLTVTLLHNLQSPQSEQHGTVFVRGGYVTINVLSHK